MNRPVRPAGVGAPSANYELAVLSSSHPERPTRQLFTSGIGPTLPDGTVPDAIEDQAAAVWATLASLLADAALQPSDVVQVTTFVVDPRLPEAEDAECLSTRLAAAMSARDQALRGHTCASVLVPVPALATGTWKMEVALVAVSSD